MGASVGLAAKRAGVDVVTGWDPDTHALAVATERGAVDEPHDTLATALAGAELAVVAAPVAALADQVRAALGASGDDCTVTDVGSTKAAVCAAAAGSTRFLGGHPIAGAELHGPRARDHDALRRCDVVPLPAARHRAGALPAGARLRRRARRDAVRDRAGGARPPRRRRLAPAPRARERAGQPGRRLAHRRQRPARGRGGIVPRHDARRGREPAHLGGHPSGQRRGRRRTARRSPPRAGAARARARRGRRGLPRALDRRRGGQPPPHAGGGVRRPGRAAARDRPRHRPAGRAGRDHAGARRRADQHRGHGAGAHLGRTRRHRDAAGQRRGRRPPEPPSCSKARGTASWCRP